MEKVNHIKVNFIELVLFPMLLFGYPVVFYLFPVINILPYPIVQFSCGIVLCYFLAKKKNLKIQRTVVTYLLILLIMTAIYTVVHFDKVYYSQFIVIILVLIGFLAVYNFLGIRDFVDIYVKSIMLIGIGGMISFLLVMLFHLSPIFEYENMDSRPGYFFGLTCTNTYMGSFIRYAGIFDEPGAMGFWGIFAIIMNKLIFNNRKIEYILIVTLSLTFSLAFYIQIIVLKIGENIKSIKKILLFSIISILTIIFLASLEHSKEYFAIWQLTLGRLEKNDSGEFSGDNRSELMDITKPVFLDNPIFGVGASNLAEMSEKRFIGGNPFTPLARDGILGTIAVYLFVIPIIFYARENKRFLVYLLVLALGFAQRPCDFRLFTIFMYTIMLATFHHAYVTNKKLKNVELY